MTKLYHYSSMSSFLKIIESSSIHCSNLSLANDPNEILLAQQEVVPEFFRDIAGLKTHLLNNSHEFFVLSFSCERDLLSQWRGYGDMGKGVMLELDLDVLKACNYSFNFYLENFHKFNESVFGSPAFEVFDVLYKRQEFKDKLSETYSDYNRIKGDLKESLKSFDLTDINLINFINRVNILSYCYKSEFYREENEVRCVIFSAMDDLGYKPNILRAEKWGEEFQQQVIFLDVQGHLSPRFPLRLKFNQLTALKSVMLGPSNPSSEELVRAALKTNGFMDTDVMPSRGHFRAPN